MRETKNNIYEIQLLKMQAGTTIYCEQKRGDIAGSLKTPSLGTIEGSNLSLYCSLLVKQKWEWKKILNQHKS